MITSNDEEIKTPRPGALRSATMKALGPKMVPQPYRFSRWFGLGRVGALLAVVSLTGVCLGFALPVRADPLAFLGSANDYAVLGTGGTVLMTNDFAVYQSATVVNGNVGVGPYSQFTHGIDATINGRLDYDTTVTLPSITGAITGGTHQMNMAPIVTAAVNGSASYAALAPTQTFSTLSEGQVVVGVSGTNVIRVTGDVTLKTTLTLNGPADAVFVFQLTASDASSAKTLTLSGMTMILTGGVTAGNIVWDLDGGGGQIAITSGGAVVGYFVAPDRSITVDHGNIIGEVIGGGDGGCADTSCFIDIHSGSTITSPGTIPDVPVPEPITLFLGGTGLLAFGYAKRKGLFRQPV